jgi:hypothetical protein
MMFIVFVIVPNVWPVLEYVSREYPQLLLFHMVRPHTQNNALLHKTPYTIKEGMELWKLGVSIENE